MPKLIRLYIVHSAIGFVVALAFVVGLVWMDVAHLRHLILDTPDGLLAGAVMVLLNGVVFAGVQFAIAVMQLAEPDDGPRSGKRRPILVRLEPVPVPVSARAIKRR